MSHCSGQRGVGDFTMSLLLIKSISFTSMLFGCLVYSSRTKIPRLSCILYSLNIVLTLHTTISFMCWFVYEESSVSLPEFTKYSVVLRLLGLESRVITVMKYAVASGCQLMTLVGFWRHRNLLAKIMTEAKDNLKTHNRRVLSLSDWYRILIYPVLIASRFVLISSTVILDGGNSISMIFCKSFILWAQMAPICVEGQFAAFGLIVETALMDINQRIKCFGSDVIGYRDRSNSHHDDNYRHPFFQYREITPTLSINIRSSLINLELNKRRGLNQEILNPGESGVLKNLESLGKTPGVQGARGTPGAFKAIEEEKQPARNQFATESRPPAPLRLANLLRLRLFGKISLPKGKGRLSSSKIQSLGTVSSLPDALRREKVESFRKGLEMRELTKQHSRVARAAADLSKGFEIQLAAIQLSVRVNCPLNLYVLLLYLKPTSTPVQNCCSAGWIVAAIVAHQIIRLLIVCDVGQRVLYQDEITRRNLLALSRSRIQSELLQEVETFLTQAELSRIEFKAGLDTRVDMSLLSSILVSVLTILIILSQFSIL